MLRQMGCHFACASATLLVRVPANNYHPHAVHVSKHASYQDQAEHTQDNSSGGNRQRAKPGALEWRPAGFIGSSRHTSRNRTALGVRACNVSGVGESEKRKTTTQHVILSKRDTGCSSKDAAAALTLRLVSPERGLSDAVTACAGALLKSSVHRGKR